MSFPTDKPIQINSEVKRLLFEMEHGEDHLFITGKAGTGKSTILNQFRKISDRNLVVLAPTGVAALHVKGQTIHSFFGIPPRLVASQEIPIRKFRTKLYKSLEIVIIDEASMLRADMLDHIHYLLSTHRKDPRPFGGVKIILIGDLYQLPPVIGQLEKDFFNQRYDTPYFFSAQVFQSIPNFRIVELANVYRQKDKAFIRLLQNIRDCSLEPEDLEMINSRCKSELDDDRPYITLTSTNSASDRINKQQLDKIEGLPTLYTGKIQGHFSDNTLPVDQLLVLKPQAQIMLLKNDPDAMYANGTLATILSCNPDSIRIQLSDSEQTEVEVSRQVWEIIQYTEVDQKGELKYEVIGTYTQLPVKLAWAITIHKSQGKTFEKVCIDLGQGAFEFGQTYVALSRCTSLEGIFLKRPLRYSDVQTDERIIDFLRKYR